MTASSALRGLAAGVGVGGLGAGSGGGSGSTTNSEVGLGSGKPARELQSIRKGERGLQERGMRNERDWRADRDTERRAGMRLGEFFVGASHCRRAAVMLVFTTTL